MSGDHLYRMDYRKFLQRHYETNAEHHHLPVIPIPPDSASEFGLLKADKDGRIVEFREKPTGETLEGMRASIPPRLIERRRAPALALISLRWEFMFS